MKKYIRTFVKQEKQIVKLLWQKGLFPDNFKPEDLYWESFRNGRKGRRRTINGEKSYKHSDYLPEIHYGSRDYWGEYDEHSFVSTIIDIMYWEHTPSTWEGMEKGEYPPSTFKFNGRKWFIRYLKKFPTLNRSSKINKFLYKSNDY